MMKASASAGTALDGQVARADGRLHHRAQAGLVDVQLALLQAVGHQGVHIHPNDLHAVAGKSAGGGQADVAQPQHANFVESHRGAPSLRWLDYAMKCIWRVVSSQPMS